MIRCRSDYKQYLVRDAGRRGVHKWRFHYVLKYPTLYFLRVLRAAEYHSNMNGGLLRRTYSSYLKAKLRVISIVLGFTIPINTCGPGLALNHWGTIVVSPSAKIGSDCRVNVCVNIGLKDGLAPKIGNNVYIGPGAKIFGGITIGDNVSIGANAVVNRDVLPDQVVVGVPARPV